jgi:DNA-binding beta-propeller fold protein YncE
VDSLYVAEAGAAGDTELRAGFRQVSYRIGRTARITRVLPSGEQRIVLDGLPSVRTPDDIYGVTAVAVIGETLYALTAAGGRDVNDPTFDNAVPRVSDDGQAQQLVDLTLLNYDEPPLARLTDPRADVEGGVPFGMTASVDRLYVTDANLETVTEIGLDGSHRRLVELPLSNHVLVGLAPAPDGSLWLAEYGAWPHGPGSSKISRLTLDGVLSDAWPGLLTAIGVAFGPDGSAYALEFSTGSGGRRVPTSGALLRRSPEGQVETVVDGLNYPTGLTIGPDGNAYISENGHRSEDGTGQVIRVRLAMP